MSGSQRNVRHIIVGSALTQNSILAGFLVEARGGGAGAGGAPELVLEQIRNDDWIQLIFSIFSEFQNRRSTD